MYFDEHADAAVRRLWQRLADAGLPSLAEGALFLGVTVTADLLAFHAGMHAALAGQPVEHWPYYLPGNWVPHCTLAEGLDKMQAARASGLLLGYEPITATVTSAGIKDTRTGEITLLTG